MPFVCEKGSVSSTNNGSFSYSTANTANATTETTNSSVYLYAGQLFTAGTCGVAGAVANGNTWLRLNNPSGQEVASNDDAGGSCGLGSSLSLVIPTTGSYVIRAGCYSSTSCSGTVAYQY